MRSATASMRSRPARGWLAGRRRREMEQHDGATWQGDDFLETTPGSGAVEVDLLDPVLVAKQLA